jgi:polyhydroxyalkanoate synthesis regulator phasin
MRVEDLRKTFEAAVGNLTPSKAQQMARGLLEPGAAKDQVARTATDLLEWSHKNRERLQSFIRREIQEQLRQMGLATQADVDALKKRVRDLERAAATAGGRKRSPAPTGEATKRGSARGPAAPAAPTGEATGKRRGTGQRGPGERGSGERGPETAG